MKKGEMIKKNNKNSNFAVCNVKEKYLAIYSMLFFFKDVSYVKPSIKQR